MSARSKVLLLIAVIIVSAVIGRTSLGERFEAATLISTLRTLGNSGVAIPLYFLIFGLATAVLGPAVGMVVVAGVTWGLWPGWVIAWGAMNVWANVHFAIGRWVAGDALKAWLERRGVKWLQRELEQGGLMTTIMVRQLPFPFLLVNLSGGASPTSWRDWALGNALGLIPNSIIYAQLAAALADGVEGARETALMRVLIAGAGIFALGLFTRWLRQRYSTQQQTP